MKPPKGGAGLEKVLVSYVGGTDDQDEWIPISKVPFSFYVHICGGAGEAGTRRCLVGAAKKAGSCGAWWGNCVM